MYRSRNDLKEKLIKAFCQRPEIYTVVTFGREVEGKEDNYSDIDLILGSSDLKKTASDYKNVLAQISAIGQTLPLVWDRPDTYAEMIILADYSPYQKIDLTIVDDPDKQKAFGPFKVWYSDETKHKKSETKINSKKYTKDAVYRMNDILFSIPRFTKCFYRNDPEMYRRWKGATEALMVLLEEKYSGWQKETTKIQLDSVESKMLFKKMTENDKKLISKIFPTNGKLDLMSSFTASVRWLTNLTKTKCEFFDLDYPDDFVKMMLAFLEKETTALSGNATIGGEQNISR